MLLQHRTHHFLSPESKKAVLLSAGEETSECSPVCGPECSGFCVLSAALPC